MSDLKALTVSILLLILAASIFFYAGYKRGVAQSKAYHVQLQD